MSTKTCSKCKESKPLDLFYARKDASDGRVSSCKACHLIKGRMRYADQEQRKLVLEKNAKWRGKNKDYIKQAQRRRYEENKEKFIAAGKIWATKNPEKMKLAIKRWADEHPDAIKQKNKRHKDKSTSELSDAYIANSIMGMKVEDVPSALIEAKRIQIKIQRLLKNGNQ